MTRSNVRRTSVSWLVGLVLLGAASACHTGSTKLGAGDTVNLCDGVEILNGLPEPDIADRQAILDYTAAALRVVDRIDTGRDVQSLSDQKIAVPGTISSALKAERTAYQALQKQLAKATTAPELHDVVQGFATSSAFAAADSTVELWTGNECG